MKLKNTYFFSIFSFLIIFSIFYLALIIFLKWNIQNLEGYTLNDIYNNNIKTNINYGFKPLIFKDNTLPNDLSYTDDLKPPNNNNQKKNIITNVIDYSPQSQNPQNPPNSENNGIIFQYLKISY